MISEIETNLGNIREIIKIFKIVKYMQKVRNRILKILSFQNTIIIYLFTKNRLNFINCGGMKLFQVWR